MASNKSASNGERDQRPELDEAAAIEAIKREMFGRKAHLAAVKIRGSGISETSTISAPLVGVFEDYENVNIYLGSSEPWAENQAMIVKLFGPILARASVCPGSKSTQCCHAEPGHSCFPRWREREDAEWYALKIHQLMGQVGDRIKGEGKLASALAADKAFELACMFLEALNKIRWDEYAQSGERSAKGGKKGRETQEKTHRRSDAEISSMINARIHNGSPKMVAYRLVGQEAGTPWETVRKQFARHKKMIGRRGA